MKKMSSHVWSMKWQEGMTYLSHSMMCAEQQVRAGCFFAFEHPARASSWKQDCVERVKKLPGVSCIVIDMCMLGLCSKVGRIPMRKRTTIMTNSKYLKLMLATFMATKLRQV